MKMKHPDLRGEVEVHPVAFERVWKRIGWMNAELEPEPEPEPKPKARKKKSANLDLPPPEQDNEPAELEEES